MDGKEILPYSSRNNPSDFLEDHKESLLAREEKFGSSERTKLALYHLLYDEEENPENEKGSTDYIIPYTRNCIVRAFNIEKTPYKIFEQFPELAAKLKFLPQYGILHHTLEGVKYAHEHDRKIHSLDAALISEKIANNNNFSKQDLDLLILACCLHDIATPTGGDVTMKIFKDLKEEENFEKFFSYYQEIPAFMKSNFGVEMKDLEACVKNQGVHGKLLDIADKTAYTLRDIDNLLYTKTAAPLSLRSPLFLELQTLVNNNPFLGEIINDIKIENELIYFKDIERLYTFLLARVYMHNIIYLNPEVHTREHIMGLIIAFLIEQNIITKEELLLGKKDRRFLTEYFFKGYAEGDKKIVPYSSILYPDKDFFEKQCFDSEEEREKFTKSFLETNPEYTDLIFYIKTPKFKSGAAFLVEKEGEKIPLSQAINGEQRLEKLETLAMSTQKYLLLYPAKEFLEKKDECPLFYEFLRKQSIKK